jgi:transmembrane sensor
MTAFSEMPRSEQALMEEASLWNERLASEPALEFSEPFLSWRAMPGHAEALRAVERSRAALSVIATDPQVLALRGAALARIGQSRNKRSPRRGVLLGAFAACLLIACVAGGYLFLLQGAAAYVTDIGERRVVVLSDGSRLSLDSDTQIDVHFSKAARLLTLERGRARFDVAHDVTRPFLVSAGDRTVIAVGTSFSVERLGPKVLVTLIQGRVVIKDTGPTQKAAPQPAVSLIAGEELVAVAEKPPSVAAVDLKQAAAWEAGRLVFKDEPLSEAVDRINRYTQKPITIAPAVASLRISGGFNAGDVGSFVAAVTSFFPVQATTTEDNGILLEPRS